MIKTPKGRMCGYVRHDWTRESIPLFGLYRYVRPKGYDFSAVLAINRVSILAINFGIKYGMIFVL